MSFWIKVIAVASLILTADAAFATTVSQVNGNYANWPIQWTVISSANDPIDSGVAGRLDFIGDNLNPAGYWARDNSYVYVRARVNTSTVGAGTYSDSLLVLIDVAGMGTANLPDYAFAWDSKSGNNASHGLEMGILNTSANTWNGINMKDLDGSSDSKGTNDINGNSRTADGYVRSVDSQSTVNFGTTSFIDYAVSWNYLVSYTGLNSNQTWSLAFASISSATDHGNLGQNGDISGTANPTSFISVGWTEPFAANGTVVPEPSTIALLGFGLGALFSCASRRRSSS